MGKLVTFNGRNKVLGYVQALLEGFRRRGYDVCYDQEPMGHNHFMVYSGMESEFDEQRERCIEMGIPVLITDLGYMHRSNDSTRHSKGYYQVSMGGLGWVPSQKCSPDRFEQLNWPVAEQRDTSMGRRVMIAGQVPNDTQHRLTNEELGEWYLQQLQNLIEDGVSKKEIFFRSHPHAPIVPKAILRAGLPIENGTKVPLMDSMIQCRAVVTFNSTLFYDAAKLGVPFICDESAHYSEWAFRRFSEIKQFKYHKRIKFFHKMAYAQWTLPEMSGGLALEFIKSEIEQEI